MKRAAVALCASSVLAVTAWAWPTYHGHPNPEHSPLMDADCQLLRTVRDETVSPSSNPGVRAFARFSTEPELQALKDVCAPILNNQGFSLISPLHAALYRFQLSYMDKPPPVNMLRVTGRPEGSQQVAAPWGYGDDFDETKLPLALQRLVARVRSLPGLQLGPLRDVTINFRRHGFLRLDPHLDPAADGENVFILGLDSDTVLTLCPHNLFKLTSWLESAKGALMSDERELTRAHAQQSWTAFDIDVLAEKGTLILLHGDARWAWTHGTRAGVQLPLSRGAGAVGCKAVDGRMLYDWWGSMQHLVARGQERTSVVLAFGKPEGSMI